ncbi:organic hydroperoxide resistance protein [Streptomyces sodiiphilus]|uniref:Organic hydroperoxide resistance protein n=1 Tax=Streptomyces sodiiphilus TaxID=226217 RepID=A0ABN2NVC5_9ACTN
MFMKPDQVLYTASATAENGRDGRVMSDDGHLDLIANAPPELGGSGAGTNPEQLFAAGFSSCFQSAMGVVARMEKKDISGSTVTASVGLGRTDDGMYELRVEIVARVPSLDKDEARELVEKANQVCPYSRATRGNIEVVLSVA